MNLYEEKQARYARARKRRKKDEEKRYIGTVQPRGGLEKVSGKPSPKVRAEYKAVVDRNKDLLEERRNPWKIALSTPVDKNESELESIISSSLRVGGFMPDPVTTAQALVVQGPKPKTPEQWDSLWKTYYDEMFKARALGVNPLLAIDSADSLSALSAIMGATGYGGPTRVDYSIKGTEKPEELPNTYQEVAAALRYQREIGVRYNEITRTITNFDDLRDMVEMKREFVRRCKQYGYKTEFDPNVPTYDADFERVYKMAIFGRQLAFYFWGTNEERSKAKEILIRYLKTPWGQESLKQTLAPDLSAGKSGRQLANEARQYNVAEPKWGEHDTLDSILKALGTKEELVREVIFNGWQFGRPVGQSESASRYAFARKFGLDFMPEAQRKAYEEEKHGVIGAMQRAGGMTLEAAEGIWNAGEKIPVFGDVLSTIGGGITWAAKKADPTIQRIAEIEEMVLKFPTALRRVVHSEGDVGMSYQDLMDYAEKHAGSVEFESEAIGSRSVREQLSLLADLSRFWESVKRNMDTATADPFGDAFEDISMSYTGRKPAWIREITPILTFASEVAVSVLIGDKGVSLAGKVVTKSALKAARGTAPAEDVVNVARKTVQSDPLTYNEWLKKYYTPPKITSLGEKELPHRPKYYENLDAFNGLYEKTPSPKKRSAVAAAKAVDEWFANPSQVSFENARRAILNSLKNDRRRARDLDKKSPIKDGPSRTEIVNNKISAVKSIEYPKYRAKPDIRTKREYEVEDYSPEDSYKKYLENFKKNNPDVEVLEYHKSIIAHKWFRTNAEVISQIDDPVEFALLYLKTDTPEVKAIAKKIAAERDPEKITDLLHELAEHGEVIDGGQYAIGKGMLARAIEKGKGYDSPLRVLYTPTYYGRYHRADNSHITLRNVAINTKMGKKGKLSAEDKAKINKYVRRMWLANTNTERQAVLDDFMREVKRNLGEDGWKKYEDLNRKYRRGKGLQVVETVRSRAWMPVESRRTASGVKETSLSTFKPGHPGWVSMLEEARAEKKFVQDFIKEHPEIDPKKVEKAHRAARERVALYRKTMQKVYDLEKKDADVGLKLEERRALDEALDILEREFSTAVPFHPEQLRQHLDFGFDPEVMMWHMHGKAGDIGLLANAWVLDPIMKVWKETVMATLSFPIRVMLCDEAARVIPENALFSKSVREGRKYIKEHDIHGARNGTPEFEESIKASHFGKYIEDESNVLGEHASDWGTSFPDLDPEYYTHLSRHLNWLRRTVIAKTLVKKTNGRIPTKDDIRNIVDDLSKSDSTEGRKVREMFEETYRADKRWDALRKEHVYTYNNRDYRIWLDQYAEQMEIFLQNPILSQGLYRRISARELKSAVREGKIKKEYLPGVIRPDPGGVHNIRTGNVLNVLPKVNIVPHLFYKHITTNLLGTMSKATKELVYSKKFWEVRKDILERARRDNVFISDEEINTVAHQRAVNYVTSVSYSRSMTAFESMTRNIIPFNNAYRQFAVYWGKQLAKHPVSMPVYFANNPRDSEFGKLGPFSYYVPYMPFWAGSGDSKVEDTTTSGKIKSYIASQTPMVAFPIAIAGKLAAENLGYDPDDLARWPLMSGVNIPPLKAYGDLFYALGYPAPSGTLSEAIFGDQTKLNRAYANYTIAGLKYGPEAVGPEIQKDLPTWLDVIARMTDFKLYGAEDSVRTEMLLTHLLRRISPVSAGYMPEEIEKRNRALGDYAKAKRAGDEIAMARLRAENPDLDKIIRYEEADDVLRAKMRENPDNAHILPYFVSPWRFDNYYRPYASTNSDLFADGVTQLTRRQHEEAIHNAFQEIYGGEEIRAGENLTWKTNGAAAVKEAKVKLDKLLKSRRDEIKKIAEIINKQNPKFTVEMMMYWYDNPELNYDFWRIVLSKAGKNPEDYNPATLKEAFKIENPYIPVDEKKISEGDIIRAEQLGRTFPGWDKFLKNSEYRKEILESRQKRRELVLKKAIYESGDEWYWMSPGELMILGVKFKNDDEIMEYLNVQMELQAAYRDIKKHKIGSREYREARNRYWDIVDSKLKKIRGGGLLAGGLGERMLHIPYFTTPQLNSVGAGKNAVDQWRAWHDYVELRNAELAKGNYNSKKVRDAWHRIAEAEAKDADDMTVVQHTALEKGRVVMWNTILDEATRLRNELKYGYSSYYKGRGNSARSKEGKKRVEKINNLIESCARVNPLFRRDIETFFYKGTNIGYRLLDWYNY